MVLFIVLTWSCVVLFFLPGQTFSAQCQETLSSRGTDFILGIPGLAETNNTVNLYITCDTISHIRVLSPHIYHDSIGTCSNYTTMILKDRSLLQINNGSAFMSINVWSSAPVGLQVILMQSTASSGVGGYMALPTKVLSTKYVIASYAPLSEYYSQFMIVGTENDTGVSIRVNRSTKLTRTLQKYEAFQYKSETDLSGTVVTSTKPVAVFSGSSYSRFPTAQGNREYLVEQMIPTDLWMKRFIVPPIYPQQKYFIKIFAMENGTEISLRNSSHHSTHHLDQYTVFELLLETDPLVVVSNKPINIVQYDSHKGKSIGDRFMTNVQAISQFTDRYKIHTQPYYVHRSTISVTIKTTDVNGLVLQGNYFSLSRATNITVPSPLQDYMVFFVEVAEDAYYTIHHRKNVSFGMSIYGTSTDDIVLGRTVEMSFPKNYCTTNSTTVTVPSVTVTPIAVIASSKAPGSDTWCFSCTDYLHLKYCEKVEQCQNDDQVCYVQRYRGHTDTLYRSGCIDNYKCHAFLGQAGCIECCNGSFCNTKGCGDNGTGIMHYRGPYCFDCNHRNEKETCTTVTICSQNEVCTAEKYRWGNDEYYYIQRCSNALTCAFGKRSFDYRGAAYRRNTAECTNCCSSDFCNMNCTSRLSPPIVGECSDAIVFQKLTLWWLTFPIS